MKIRSEILADALERIGLVLNLQKAVTNDDYRKVQFRVIDDTLSLTATDGYLVAEIQVPIEDGEGLDSLVNIQRLTPFARYVDGAITLKTRKGSILASCGKAQCSAEISEGFLPSPTMGNRIGELTLTKAQLNALMAVRETGAAKEINKNINLLMDQHSCAATVQQDAFVCIISGAHTGLCPNLVPPTYTLCAMQIIGGESIALDLCEPGGARVDTGKAVVTFPSVDGPPATPALADIGAYAEPTHVFDLKDIAPAIVAMNDICKNDEYIWATIEPDGDGFLIKHRDSDFTSLGFCAEVSHTDWRPGATFNARRMLLAMKHVAGGKVHVIVHPDGIHSILVFVNDPVRMMVAPGGFK